MSVRRIRVVVGVVTLGFVLALVLGSAGLLGGGRALGSSTTITLIGGDVSIRHGSSGTFIAAVDGEILSPGDAIRTGADARAVLTYFEGSSVTVEPNTELAIDAAAAQGNDTIVQMTQTAGRTWHVVTKLVTGSSKYEVRTPASTASVRGTAFTVDADATTTTITTSEGTVIDRVPDPTNPGQTIDVPVRAGEQHAQERGQSAGPSHTAPAPDRKVTITLSDENAIVIDTLGRANGIDKNGKVIRQTPGATLEKVDGHLVITLPNIPDGLLQVLVRKQDGDVDVQTVVGEHGSRTTSTGKASAGGASGDKRVVVQIGGVNGKPKASEPPEPEPTRAPGGGSGAPGQTGQGGQGQGGGPSRSPGFVPPSVVPTRRP